MSGRRALWVSTSTQTRGGVATYVRTMQRTPLWSSWDITHVTTHRNGSLAKRAGAFAVGATRFVAELVVRRPALVHLHTASYGSFARKALLAWVARGLKVQTLVHVHGAAFEDFHDRSPRLVQRAIRVTLERAGAVIALGDAWAQVLQRIAPGARVVVVPNAVEPGVPVEQPGPAEPVQVLFLGEVEDRKGAFLLLESWALLPADVTAHAQLTLAGGGEVARARTSVEQLRLAGSVVVSGHLSPAEVDLLLRRKQVLVLPSTFEGQPMAILEAMAHGHCVVATGVGGIPDLLGDSGVLVPVGDREALAEALRLVITDHERRAELGGRAFQRMREKFDVNHTWRALDELYGELTR